MLSIMRTQCRIAFKAYQLYLSPSILDNSLSALQFKCAYILNRKYYGKPTAYPSMNEGTAGSRYHPLSAIESTEIKIKEQLSNSSPNTIDEWDDIKNVLMNEHEILSELNFSSVMMNCLLHQNKLKEAHSFMDYLKKMNMEPNHLTYLKYMALCGRNFEHCDQELILQTYEKVKLLLEAAPVLDKIRAEHVIQGLCGTDKWLLALQYLKKVPQNSTNEMKSSIASAAIRNNDENLAWEIITRWFKLNEIPTAKVFKSFLLYCLKLQVTESKRSEKFLLRFFQYLQQKGAILNEEEIQLVEKYFKGHTSNWNISYSKFNRHGECDACHGNIQITDFSNEDFEYLRDAFLKKSLRKSDLFINTTQEEFDRYIKFIQKFKPFHIVLDGLNVAYTAPNIMNTKNNKVLALQLLKVVQHFWTPSRKLLILGRHHMRYWPDNIMRKISKKATFFLTNNISQDDPFMVYAALESGPHCYVVTLDLLRDHMSRLDDPKTIALFKRWQQTHQICLTVENKELKFVEPLKYSINIHGNMQDGWHIPFDDKIILDPYEELNNWLCIQKVI